MTNLHESCLARHGFDITTSGLKTDYRSTALPTALSGQVNMRCMYVYMCACVPECACAYAGDGWLDGQRMDKFKSVHVCACMCARPCVRVYDHVGEDGITDARSDG